MDATTTFTKNHKIYSQAKEDGTAKKYYIRLEKKRDQFRVLIKGVSITYSKTIKEAIEASKKILIAFDEEIITAEKVRARKVFLDNKKYKASKLECLKRGYRELEKYKDYFASKDGKVYSVKSNEIKEMKQGLNRYGYKTVEFKENGRRKTMTIHRIVAILFIKNDNKKRTVVNHIDRNRTNNYYKNLEWTTVLENNMHSIEVGRRNRGISKGKGKNVGTTELPSGRFEANIKIRGKSKYIGSFDTRQEARDAYQYELAKSWDESKVYILTSYLKGPNNL